jgi:hypothetical protein
MSGTGTLEIDVSFFFGWKDFILFDSEKLCLWFLSYCRMLTGLHQSGELYDADTILSTEAETRKSLYSSHTPDSFKNFRKRGKKN